MTIVCESLSRLSPRKSRVLLLRYASALIALAVLSLFVDAQTRSNLELEGLSVKAGEKTTGFIEVAKGIDDGTQIPVSVFHGVRDGKVMVIIAGVHGSEYSPILALQRLAKRIEPKELAGTVVLVHVANLPSFQKRTIYYGADGKNLNRVFPGKIDGTITERIAYVLTEKLIRRADYFIDVHSGDGNESLRPYVVYYESEQAPREIVEISRRMAIASGIDFVKIARGRPSTLATATFTTNTALLLGKAAMAIESGELGPPMEGDIARSEEGLLNVLRELKMIPGPVTKFKNRTFIIRDQTVRSTANGIFYSLVKRDQRVKANDLLGYITDYFGNRVQEVRAPFTGVVMYYTATPPVSEGEPLVNIGEIEVKRKL
jgi:predicted deacylase